MFERNVYICIKRYFASIVILNVKIQLFCNHKSQIEQTNNYIIIVSNIN